MPSTIPAAIDALIERCTAAATDVQIIDGQVLNTEQDYIAIGYTRDASSPAVTLTQSALTAGFARERESYDISCEVSSWNGDMEQKVARDRAFELLTVVESVVAADRKLGGAALQVNLIGGDLVQGLAGTGAAATVIFSLHVDAQK